MRRFQEDKEEEKDCLPAPTPATTTKPKQNAQTDNEQIQTPDPHLTGRPFATGESFWARVGPAQDPSWSMFETWQAGVCLQAADWHSLAAWRGWSPQTHHQEGDLGKQLLELHLFFPMMACTEREREQVHSGS